MPTSITLIIQVDFAATLTPMDRGGAASAADVTARIRPKRARRAKTGLAVAGGAAMLVALSAGPAAATASPPGYTGSIQAYSTPVTSATADFEYSGATQVYRAPQSGIYIIYGFGAQGGSGGEGAGGIAAGLSGDFLLTSGETLLVTVGEQGAAGTAGSGMAGAGGGGGGSFVVGNSPFIVAGGGGTSGGGASSTSTATDTETAGAGGAGVSNIFPQAGGGPGGGGGSDGNGGASGQSEGSGGGGGGGGYRSTGGSADYSGQGGASFTDGLAGGMGGYYGGFGGGGGGFSGGGGGGSYDADASGTTFAPADVGTGNGEVYIQFLYAIAGSGAPEPSSLGLLGAALVGHGLLARRFRRKPARSQ